MKYFAVFVCLLLALTTYATAATEAQEPVADPAANAECSAGKAAESQTPAEELTVREWAEQLGLDVFEDPTAKQASSCIPCPFIRQCNGCDGTKACRKSGTPSTTDTGASCCEAAGYLVSCGPGKTIHVTTTPCSKCPCCSGSPPNCFCGPSCAPAQELSCQ